MNECLDCTENKQLRKCYLACLKEVHRLDLENEQLEQKVSFYKYFQKDARELAKENERLTIKNQKLEKKNKELKYKYNEQSNEKMGLEEDIDRLLKENKELKYHLNRAEKELKEYKDFMSLG